VSFWCQHIWTAYHCTEFYYFNGSRPVLRWFEVCQTCQAKRVLEENVNSNEERKAK
jgi:hypothetical protein